MSKPKPRRTLVLTDTAGQVLRELELERAAAVNLSSGREFIYIENDGRGWRLTWTTGVVPDIAKLGAITMLREDK